MKTGWNQHCGAVDIRASQQGAFSPKSRSIIAESFTPRLRYSGSSIGCQLASIIAGGPAPLIATALFASYKSGAPIAIYILICSIISIIATAFLKDYTGRDISAEYDRDVQAWSTMSPRSS